MLIYSALVNVTTNFSTGQSRFASKHFKFEAENSAEAKQKLLTESRKYLKKFRPTRDRFVQIDCAPYLITEKGVLNGDKLLRNRHKFSTIPSLMRTGAEKIFVEGYGPKQWDDLVGQ